ncbi:MAG TPA: hypothetical protein DCY02_10635, partial [Armatimonadetes bacterium]|nr:hypothetical protein [Armatimonadota bacterium]
ARRLLRQISRWERVFQLTMRTLSNALARLPGTQDRRPAQIHEIPGIGEELGTIQVKYPKIRLSHGVFLRLADVTEETKFWH